MKNDLLIGIMLVSFMPAVVFGQSSHRLPVPGIDITVHTPSISDSSSHNFLFQQAMTVKKINNSLFYVSIDILPEALCQPGDIDIPITIALSSAKEMATAKKSFHWIPNIKKTPDNIVSQHVFRSPCMILTLKQHAAIFIPDIGKMKNNAIAPYYFDLNYGDKNILINYGISNYKVVPHQYYAKSNALFTLSGKLEMAFYILITDPVPLTALKAAGHFMWKTFAKEYTHSYLPQTVPYEKYADVGYSMALRNYWIQVPGADQGGITLSTFYDDSTKKYGGRFYKDDLWFHSWFNNMRTAYGLFYWGKTLRRTDWEQKATACLNLILNSPNDKGWFPTIYVTGEKRWLSSGQGGGAGLYHLPDNVWTAYWVMRFDDEMQAAKGARQFVQRFSQAIVKVQNKDGSFPARINTKTHLADSVLQSSAVSSIATWYLEEAILRKKVPASLVAQYKYSIVRSLDFLSSQVLPAQKFEDFELYFSCSPKPMHYFDSTTYLYGQNTLSIQWCAEAFLKAYQIFRDAKYLRQGEYCLNILSLYQQVWNPPFIHLYAFGGFGVQNTDAEWNDARQAQFAETYLNYYFVTRNHEYLERAVYACRSSFSLMVLPENKMVCPDNYLGTADNGESQPGNMAENYGHDGFNARSYQSGFHWGTGSALTSAAIFKSKLGDLYVDQHGAIGIDGIVVDSIRYTRHTINIATKRLMHGNIQIVADPSVKLPLRVDDAASGFIIK